jgi:hypothetical protein
MSARFLTAYLATAALLVGVFAQAAAKPPQLPVKLEIECSQPDSGEQDLEYALPEPVCPPPAKMPQRVFRVWVPPAASVSPLPPAKMVQRVYQVADLVIPLDRDPHTDASPMPANCGGYPPQPVPQVQSYPQSAYQYCPVPVAAEKVKLPALPRPYCPPACANAKPTCTEFEPLPISGMFAPFGFLEEAPPSPIKREQVKLPDTPRPGCPAACARKDQCKEIQVRMQESQAGSLLLGYSDAGLTGSMVLNERNFDAIYPQPPQAPRSPGCCAVMRSEQPRKTLEDQLIKLIVNTVQPESWKECGGEGTIEYYPLGMALVIHQTPDVQEQVADLLVSLRRLQDVEVAVEVRIVTVPKAFLGQVVHDLGLKFTKCQKEGCVGPCPAACSKSCCSDTPCEGLALLNDSEVAKFFKKIQADPHTNVMQSPKMTMFNGQASTINIMDTQFFVTDMHFRWIGDQVVCFPQNEPVSTGLEMTVQPVVSADQKYVRVSWSASLTQVDTPVPLCPITTQITPTFEGGAKGQPEPFTVFIQQPSLLTQRVKKTVCIPDHGTALLTAWTTCREVPEEVELPLVSRIPYVSELFKMVRNHEETTTTVMMVTPKIICNSEQEAVKAPASDPGPTVVENLQKLEQAQRLFKKAEECRWRGQQDWAAHAYQKIQELCPGSRMAQMAARRYQQLHAVEACPEPRPRSHAPRGNAGLDTLRPAGNGVATQSVPPVRSHAERGNESEEAAELLGKYYQACAEGHLAEATQWAIQALAIDPACFRKEKDKRVSHPMLNAN